MRTRPDVDTQVDPPELRAVELVGVEVLVARVAHLGHVLGVGRVPLDDDLVVTVPVQVGDGGVVRTVRVGLADGRDAVGRLVQRDVEVPVAPDVGRRRSALARSAERHDAVPCVRRTLRVEVVGRVLHLGDQPAVAVHGEAGPGQAGVGVTGDLRGQQPPAQEHPLAGRGRHQSAVQPFGPGTAAGPVTLRRPRSARGCGRCDGDAAQTEAEGCPQDSTRPNCPQDHGRIPL